MNRLVRVLIDMLVLTALGVPVCQAGWIRDGSLNINWGDEADPLWGAVSNAVVSNAANGQTAFGWGDHGAAGYATGTPLYAESDPAFSTSVAASVSGTLTGQWSQAYGWGDHSSAGYATGTPVYVESDPLFSTSVAAAVTAVDTGHWAEAYGWGDHSVGGYATGTPLYVESDPVFSTSVAASVTSTHTGQWSQAYEWGDHNAAGYVTSGVSQAYVDAGDAALSNAVNGRLAVSGPGHTQVVVTVSAAQTDLSSAEAGKLFVLTNNAAQTYTFNLPTNGLANVGGLVYEFRNTTTNELRVDAGENWIETETPVGKENVFIFSTNASAFLRIVRGWHDGTYAHWIHTDSVATWTLDADGGVQDYTYSLSGATDAWEQPLPNGSYAWVGNHNAKPYYKMTGEDYWLVYTLTSEFDYAPTSDGWSVTRDNPASWTNCDDSEIIWTSEEGGNAPFEGTGSYVAWENCTGNMSCSKQ